MCIVEAQVKRASEEDEPVGWRWGRGWRSGGAWIRWGGTYCESEWHEAKWESQSARKGITGYPRAEKLWDFRAHIHTHSHTSTHTSCTTSRGFGWRIHCGVEVTESSTNRQHTHMTCDFSLTCMFDLECMLTCILLYVDMYFLLTRMLKFWMHVDMHSPVC